MYTSIIDSFDETNINREIQRRIKQGEPVRVSDVQQYIHMDLNKEVGRETTRKTLHKLGYR